jgi:hypothetical protein
MVAFACPPPFLPPAAPLAQERSHAAPERFSSYPVMPEKGKLAWVCWYQKHRPDERWDLLTLQLLNDSGLVEDELQADLPNAWARVGVDPETRQEVWQVKVPFLVPNTTFRRRVFLAVLVRRGAWRIELGGLSVVSTANQREKGYPKIDQQHRAAACRKLVQNFRNHPSGQRHYKNGKGSGQNTQTSEGLFMEKELAVAVPLPITFLEPSYCQ